MNLAQFERRRYNGWATPIEKLDRFSEALDGPEIYIKRDDLLGLSAGGNKTRKLEFLVADAIDQGADTLVTCGAVQSNHCRLTLAAAVKEGMKCRLILEERVAGSYKEDASGNNFLFKLLGVESITVVPGGSDMAAAMEKEAEAVRQAGRKAYVIPGGGSNTIGATGYVACAEEIMQQLFEIGTSIDHIVCPSGSTGTHAGLITGFYGTNANIPITGVNVSRKKGVQEEMVYKLVLETAKKVGVNYIIPRESVVCLDQYVGPGYSLPTAEMAEAVRLLARTEGILLDPVYSGKTMAGMIGMIRQGVLKKGQKVLFVHTGGSPALYAYMKEVLEG
ncbi:MAG: D-cysteine desulfhydrase [Deltaproteobacteria bacterium]|jgi:D-cysteine desulfhydrase|nr:D-cysteine desulfhydrase [Deltaproteobacteria bacterium]